MGGSGYTGSELLRILLKHPHVNIKALIGETSAGRHISEVFSSFQGIQLPIIDTFVNTNLKNIDVLFSCTPSGVLSENINKLPNNLLVIDLSSDFRFQNVEIYNEYYEKHKNPDYVKRFIYGLTEIFKEQIKNKKFISCPGCYPTSILLPLIPLLKNNLVESEQIIVIQSQELVGLEEISLKPIIL